MGGKSKGPGDGGAETTVVYNDLELAVEVGCQQFSDFDDWVRRRFAIPTTDTVIYCNSKGKEIIPGPMHNRIVVSTTPGKDSSVDCVLERIVASDAWDAAVHVVPSILIVMFAIALLPQWSYVSDYLLSVQQRIPLKNMTGPWLEKSYIGFLSWSVTYLFVRRVGNPESSATAIKKYSADAIFGGFAAAGAVIIKAAVLK